MPSYERKDYSELLTKLQQEQNEKKKVPDNSAREREIISFNLLIDFFKGKVPASEKVNDAIKDVIPVFTSIAQSRSNQRFRKQTGCNDEKEAGKIVSWLRELSNEIDWLDTKGITFYKQKIIHETRFLRYAHNFCQWVPAPPKGKKGKKVEPKTYVIKEEKGAALRRQQAFSDEQIKYFRIKNTNIIHDKSCEMLKQIPVDYMEPLEDYNPSCRVCPACAIRSYLRIGAKDFDQVAEYEKLFHIMGIHESLARYMFVDLEFKTKLSHMTVEGSAYDSTLNNAFIAWYKGDAWRIGVVRRGRVRLEHNNYMVSDGKKGFTQGFHVQNEKCYSATPSYVVSIIRDHHHKPIVPEEVNTRPETRKIERMAWEDTGYTASRAQNRNLRATASLSEPGPGQLCMYLWVDEKGNKHWGAGWYNMRRQFFSACYGDNSLRISFCYVLL